MTAFSQYRLRERLTRLPWLRLFAMETRMEYHADSSAHLHACMHTTSPTFFRSHRCTVLHDSMKVLPSSPFLTNQRLLSDQCSPPSDYPTHYPSGHKMHEMSSTDGMKQIESSRFDLLSPLGVNRQIRSEML